MIEGKKVTAIILAAGNSTRYNITRNKDNVNKNFEEVKGKSLLSFSLREFSKNDYVDNIIIAAKENEMNYVQNIINEENINKKIKIVQGGEERKDSVYNSIKNSNSDIVIIHDGARPAIKQKYINECIENMDKYKGVTVGVKSVDTIKITDENDIVINTTKRSNTWAIQTPQCFDRKTLLEMHEKYKNDFVTDDCMLLEKDNYAIKIIEGDYTNLKVTTPVDLKTVNEIFS